LTALETVTVTLKQEREIQTSGSFSFAPAAIYAAKAASSFAMEYASSNGELFSVSNAATGNVLPNTTLRGLLILDEVATSLSNLMGDLQINQGFLNKALNASI